MQQKISEMAMRCATDIADILCPPLSVGTDLVQISKMVESVDTFGSYFLNKLFTEAELQYADVEGALQHERLAARFAAKEATIKALRLANAGIGWRDIEVVRESDGACRLALHGKVANLASDMQLRNTHLSLTHDGDYACAFVVCSFAAANTSTLNPSKGFASAS
jgi:holo-[acyl-carrier protein] synthase